MKTKRLFPRMILAGLAALIFCAAGRTAAQALEYSYLRGTAYGFGIIWSMAAAGDKVVLGGHLGALGQYDMSGGSFTDISGLMPGVFTADMPIIGGGGSSWLISNRNSSPYLELYSYNGSNIIDLTEEMHAFGWTMGVISSLAANGAEWLIGGNNGFTPQLITYNGTSFVGHYPELQAAGWTDGDITAIAANGTEWLIGGQTPPEAVNCSLITVRPLRT